MISVSNFVPKLTMNIAKDSLLNEETKRKENGESSSTSEAYVTEKQEGCGISKS